ncbi:hypothetical protein [Microbacterium sp. LWH3-1.2]|uniref:hypothetical protein n=1 Tax=Microbacterium sp. LWH3-1.2 TaxID=3135256 RepID=UPI003430B973
MSDPCIELATLEQAILRQDPALQSAAAFRAGSAECPYFGLPPAGVDDAERYFGREQELDRAFEDLQRHAVRAVPGRMPVPRLREGRFVRIARIDSAAWPPPHPSSSVSIRRRGAPCCT